MKKALKNHNNDEQDKKFTILNKRLYVYPIN